MRWRSILVAIALAVTATCAVGWASPRVAAAAAPAEALLVGDSVMNGMAQGYGAPARARLAARHSFILDTAGCRRLITTSCSIGSGPPPPNALTVVRGRAGQYDRTLVMAVGYNDPSSGAVGLPAAVDAIVAEAGRSGIHDVVWLTYREAGSSSNVSRFRANNAVLRAKAAQHPQLRLADWNAVSARLPTSWFSADGVHLGASAASAMADLVADALDAGPRRVDPRCAAERWVADPAAPGGAVPASVGGGVHLLERPMRLLDTRDLPGKVGAGRVVSVPVAGAPGVTSAMTAAMVSIISVEPCADGFLTAFPCGTAPPLASMLNAVAGDVVANAAIVAVGASGSICVLTSQPTDIVVDLTGYVGPDGAGTSPETPLRVVDTRAGQPQLLDIARHTIGPSGLTVDLGPVTSAAATLRAASINLTAADPTGDGYLSATPGACTGTAPSTSSLNVSTGRDAAATTTVGLIDGRFCVFSSVDTDVVIDLQATHGATAGLITAMSPMRLFDSRDVRRLSAGLEVRLPDVPGAAGGTSGAALNVTMVDPAVDGFVSLYPCDEGRPLVSNVNAAAGAITANLAVVPTRGAICVFSSVETDVVVDVEALIG